LNLDPNCYSFTGSQCTVCSTRYYFGPGGLCTLVNPNCYTYDNFTGSCTSCYSGYIVSNGDCILNAAGDQNCQSFSPNQQCIQCFQGYYLDSASGICSKMSPLCNQSNPITGTCLSCFSGYTLNTITGNC
jgi:hypothetical protein